MSEKRNMTVAEAVERHSELKRAFEDRQKSRNEAEVEYQKAKSEFTQFDERFGRVVRLMQKESDDGIDSGNVTSERACERD